MICSNKFFLILLSLFAGVQLFAAPPVPFSGKLAVDGTNFHGHALFSFSIVNDKGTVQWKHADEPDSKIENFVMNGRYLVLLGGQGMQTLPADLFLQHESLFLRVSVDLKDGQGMRLLEPDQRITSSPYALSAEIARLAKRAQVAGGVDAGAITADMIEQALLADLNRTSELGEITREMLPQDVRDDLNRTVRLQDLSEEVSQSINRPITREMLPQGVRDELNATITRDRLSADVRADLNRTIGIANLSTEVTDKLNQTFSIDAGSITLDQLSQQVRDDINRTITRDRLSSDVLSDINRTITRSMLSQEVLNELNASGGATVSIPGSLIAVPANQSAPSGYELYQKGEPKELVWEEKAPVSLARIVYRGVEVLDGKIYMAGGFADSSNSDLFERFDPMTNQWQILNSLPDNRRGIATASLNGKLYILGGNGGLTTVDIFDPNTNEWESGVDLPSQFRFGAAINVGKKIFVVGGKNSENLDSNQTLYYSSSENNWTTVANMLTARSGHDLVWFKNRIWAIGGGIGSTVLRKVESYDIDSNSWRDEVDLISPINWPAAWVANGKIYVASETSVQVYDPTSKTWSMHGNLPESRGEAAVLNARVYIIGSAPNGGSDAVYSADLNASVEGVHDLYVKTGDASTGTPTVQTEVADGSIGLAQLSSEVTDKLNQTFSIDAGSITLDQLSQQVRDDINRTITRDRLSSDVLSDINRTITKSMLSQEVLDELNASGGVTGSVPGSLIAVPANQSAPSGYELYQKGEPKELVWEEKAPIDLGIAYGGVNLNGKIYTSSKCYDPIEDAWSDISPMLNAKSSFATSVLREKIYFIGGYSGSVNVNDVQVYDPHSDTWSLSTPLPQAIRAMYAITVDGLLYVVGGFTTTSVGFVYCFNPDTEEWTNKSAMPTARWGAKLVFFENQIWAIGGQGDGPGINVVEAYNTHTNSWSSKSSLKQGRGRAAVWTANNLIFVAGGRYSDSNYLNSIEIYDPLVNDWDFFGNLPQNIFGSEAVIVGDDVFIIGGWSAHATSSNKVYAADLNASALIDLFYKTGDASTGTPTVQAEVADGSIGPSKLSSEVSNALEPVVVGQPISVVEVGGNPAYLAVDATGVNNSYQWKKNGVDIAGETDRTLSIADLNASQHEGNYTVVVSNAFGSATSSVAQIDVNGSLTEGLVGWWKFDETEGNIAYDSSGNERDGNFSAGGSWVNGKIGGAIDLNGSSVVQILNYKGVLGTTARSISMWLKSGSQNGGVLFSWGGADLEGNIHAYSFVISTSGGFHNSDYGSLKLAISNGYFVGTQKVNTNEWFHVVVVSEENSNVVNSKLFLNLSEDTALKTLSKMINTVSDRDVTLGGDLDGLLDDIRIYDRALSAFEVKALYELGEQPVQESGSGATTVVNGTVADGSITASKIADQTITTNQLSEQILKYLKPEITQQPTATNISANSNGFISVSAEGKYLTYQWKKNGVNLSGETNATLTITDANATQHDGNYSVVVSNDFGSVESVDLEILVSSFSVNSIPNIELWLDSSDSSSITLNNGKVSIWHDISVNENNATQTLANKQPEYGQDENGTFVKFTSSYTGGSIDDALADNYLILSPVSGKSSFFVIDHDGTKGSMLLGSKEHYKSYIFIGSDSFAISIDGYNNSGGPSDRGSWWFNGAFQATGSDLGASGQIPLNTPCLHSVIYQLNDPLFSFYRIGSYIDDRAGFGGKIREIIIFNGYLTEAERQKTEGYLAHKWNLVTELPSDHPYKNSAP